jgi:hypothetical protein
LMAGRTLTRDLGYRNHAQHVPGLRARIGYDWRRRLSAWVMAGFRSDNLRCTI